MGVKTHTFKLGRYHISFCCGIDGVCDVPDSKKWKDCRHDMIILEGGSYNALHSALHEAMHAEGIPDKYVHAEEGDSVRRIARFLWRLGYRKE
tara:strand:+ start:1432 stop:1710 length:279 start_codon:yes stop_codon:yes gene_type:complete